MRQESPVLLVSITLIAAVSACPADDPLGPVANGNVLIVVDADQEVGEVYSFWSVYPVTVQEPFKDRSKHEKLRKSYPYAKYINCVRFLGGIELEKDDYFRGVDAKGQAICDFTEAIALLSGIRRCGYTPWIVLDNVPAEMCRDPEKNRYGNTEPPANWQVWMSYVRQLTQALVDEFGQEEVNKWRFRVGTEPDLNPGHWTGTKEEYFKHYDFTVAAVLSVIPNADIGPGNIIDPSKKRKWQSWGLEIIDHCAVGRNSATGKIGTPMKFFASSYYTNVGTSDERFEKLIGMVRERLAKYPQFRDVPVEIQEFGILSEGGKWIVGDGTHWGGSWAAHMADEIYGTGVRRVYQWAWNTTKGGGLPIPVTHVWGMLEQMIGGKRLAVRVAHSSDLDHIGCIASQQQSRLDLIFFRHRSVRADGEPVNVSVVLRGQSITEADWRITHGSIIDSEHAGFMSAQKADMETERARLGDDANVYSIAINVWAANRDRYESMSKLSELETLPTIAENELGILQFELNLEGHSVVHLRLQRSD